MFISSNKASNQKGSEIYLSKKHIITEEELSQLCSESKQSRSSNLLQLVTRTKHKLNTYSKRTNPQPQRQQPKKVLRQQPTHAAEKALRLNKQNNRLEQQLEMNRLYEQNQKLGYRINYLNDENNFYRISINNIEKLNNNIHKKLDGHQIANTGKNKIDTKSGNLTHGINNNRQSPKLTLSDGRFMSTHVTASALVGRFGGAVGATIANPLTAGFKRRSLSRVGSINPIAVNNAIESNQSSVHRQPPNTSSPNIQATSGISSSFSQISNKIHLKNLQMRVGNSIRKTQKLKKIYEGSISSLSTKAQQLQTEINKLSRQAQYYQIESELLNNIYKADYYMKLNLEWFQMAGTQLSQCDRSTNGQNQLDSLKELSDEDQSVTSHDSDDEYAEYFKKDAHLITKLNHHKKISAQNTVVSNKLSNHNCDFTSSKPENIPNHKKNFLTKDFAAQTFSMAIRFMSGSYNNSRLGNTFKNSWYSALCNPKNKANKLSELMGMQNSGQASESRIKQINNKKTNTNPSFLQPSNHQTNSYANNDNLCVDDSNKHMTEKELFLLPKDMIQLIIGSLEKEAIQQSNKLESMRKEEREQRKTKHELIEAIDKLKGHKERLKALIDQQFSLFFMNNVNTMETVSSFTNNDMKKGSLASSSNNESNGSKHVFGHIAKSHTLHRDSSTQKVAGKQSAFDTSKPSQWISIQQRKQQADQLYMCSLYEKQLLQSIQKQDKQLQEQYKINQEYKQKIIDRNEQENKELKVLEEEVNKCMEQVKEIKLKYKSICQVKGKHVGSHSSLVPSANALPGKNKDVLLKQG